MDRFKSQFPVIAMLLMLCLAVLAGYSLRDYLAGRTRPWESLPEFAGPDEMQDWPPAEWGDPHPLAATNEVAGPAGGAGLPTSPSPGSPVFQSANRLGAEASPELVTAILRATGSSWRESSEPARWTMSLVIASWLQAEASIAERDQWARRYQEQLDLLAQQPEAESGRICDWLPLVHGRLLFAAGEDN